MYSLMDFMLHVTGYYVILSILYVTKLSCISKLILFWIQESLSAL